MEINPGDKTEVRYTYFKTFQPHTDVLFSFISLKDGRFASCSRDSTIKIYNEDFSIRHSFSSNHSKGIRAIAQLNNGMIASTGNCYQDKSITIADPEKDFSVVNTMQMNTGFGTSLFTLKNGTLVSGSAFPDNKIYLWDSDFNLIKTLTLNYTQANYVCELNDGKIVSGAFVCDVVTQEIKQLEGLSSSATALIQLEDGTIVISSEKGGLDFFDSSYNLISSLETADKITSLLKIDRDTFASGDVMGGVKIFKYDSNSQKASLVQSLDEATDRVRCMLTKGDFLIVGFNEGSMTVYTKQ